MYNVRNRELLSGWVDYLQNQAAGNLVGDKAQNNIMQAANYWNLLQGDNIYTLECPLTGKPSSGFTSQYSTDFYLQGNLLEGKLGESYNRFLNMYANKVGPKYRFYIEANTALENSKDLAIYLELPRKNPEEVIRLTLGAIGNIGIIPTVENLFSKAECLDPLMLGSIFSRLQAPVRVCFSTTEHLLRKPGRLDAMINFLKSLPDTENLINDIQELEQLGLFDFCLFIDVYPNGSIGPLYVLELNSLAFTPKELVETLRSQQGSAFIAFLQKNNLVDKRLEVIGRCCFNATLPRVNENDKEEKLLSMTSRFKINYRKGERHSAKVCIQGIKVD